MISPPKAGIDTDIGSDDAVAVIIALKQENIHIEAITGVAGNCSLDHAINNALMTIAVVNKQRPPVYRGACLTEKTFYGQVAVYPDDRKEFPVEYDRLEKSYAQLSASSLALSRA